MNQLHITCNPLNEGISSNFDHKLLETKSSFMSYINLWILWIAFFSETCLFTNSNTTYLLFLFLKNDFYTLKKSFFLWLPEGNLITEDKLNYSFPSKLQHPLNKYFLFTKLLKFPNFPQTKFSETMAEQPLNSTIIS